MAVKQCFCVAKLSPNKKSIFGLRTQILSLLFVACVVAGASAVDTEVSCSNVRSFFSGRGIPATDIQDQPNSDAAELCLNRGCCAASSKARLTQLARTQLETSLRTELNKLSDTLANRARKFDEFFLKLLQQSREDLHSMFKKTYGVIYEQHSYVFEQLFQQLQRYYTSGDTDLDNMMDTFFGIMYQKMFTVLNSQYTFDDKYLKCVIEHMRETQPFEDVPHKLSVQLRRAFVATRTFHKALRAGADVVRNMQEVGVTPECVSAWARLRWCGACGGGGAAPPACSRYCHNVLRGCLPAHAHLALHWDAYVDAVEKVADRLIGPFNIVMVVKPINIKISEAIMYFQEHNQEISQKIFTGCGKPVLGGGGGGSTGGSFFAANDRTKRAIRSIPDFDWNQKQNDVDDFEIETSFESLLKEDPSLYSLNSQEDIEITARKLAEQAKERQRFLDYMKGDIDAEEYEEHERKRREAEPEPGATEIDYRAFEFDGKRGGKKGKKTPAAKVDSRDSSAWGSPTLDRLVRETRARVRNSRRYWSSLPYLLCNENSVAAAPAPSQPCFNGSAVGSYTLAAAGEGPAALASNPEVRGALPEPAAVVTQQEALRTLTARLKDAYNGVEVKWRDAEDQQASSSFDFAETAGSGSGSGDDSDDLPDDDEDRDREHDLGPGSGHGPLDNDDEDSQPLPNEPDPDSQPPASEVPFTPVVGGAAETNNVHIHAPDSPNHDGILTRILTEPVDLPDERTSKEQPHTSAAERPSLHRALFTYALPVVCAWFGTIVTDLI